MGNVSITIEGNYTIIDVLTATPKYYIQKKSIPNEDIMIKANKVKDQLLINADGVNYVFENSEVSVPSGANAEAKMDALLTSIEASETSGFAEYKLKVQKGEVEGTVIMEAFGERDGAGTTTSGEDVWLGNDLTPSASVIIPIPPDAGDLISVVGESTSDDIAGTGVQVIRINYIDPTGNEQSLDVDMDGTTPVDTGILMRFIQTIHAIQVGTNGVAVGDIKVMKTGGSTSTDVYNMIKLGGNMSLTTNRMIPLGKKLYVQEWDASEGNNDRTFSRIRSTDFNGVLIPRVFLFKDTNIVRSSTTGQMAVGSVIPALSIIKISVWVISQGAELTAGWWGYLVDD